MVVELKCRHGIKFAELENSVLYVKCRSARCGAERGVVVLHRFDTITGELLGTDRFRDPVITKEGQ